MGHPYARKTAGWSENRRADGVTIPSRTHIRQESLLADRATPSPSAACGVYASKRENLLVLIS